MSASYEIRAVEHLGGYQLRLTFADGLVFEIDLTDKLNGQVGPVFEPLRESNVLRPGVNRSRAWNGCLAQRRGSGA